MDDTLIVNQALYERAASLLYGYLRSFGISQEEAHRLRESTDKELYKTFGYSRKRYPETFEQVLKHFVPDADAEMVQIVRDFAETVFSTVAKEKPGTIEAINLLTEHYSVYIVTQGDHSVQKDRLSHLSFKDKLSDAFIVEKKNKETFSDIAQRLGFKPDEVVMMGDSLKSDIIPSVAAGMQAVWVEADNWSLEANNEFPAERAYKFFSLLEASRHLVKHGTPATAVVSDKKKPSPKP
ncbi:MAG: HAD family hydrolase [Proteobacteria bacterium]|nr:HAD family hydrolase [Pseudomonadota bacterium]